MINLSEINKKSGRGLPFIIFWSACDIERRDICSFWFYKQTNSLEARVLNRMRLSIGLFHILKMIFAARMNKKIEKKSAWYVVLHTKLWLLWCWISWTRSIWSFWYRRISTVLLFSSSLGYDFKTVWIGKFPTCN